MEKNRIVRYENGQQLEKGVRKLLQEGWLVQTLTKLASGAARVEFVRPDAMAAKLGEQPQMCS